MEKGLWGQLINDVERSEKVNKEKAKANIKRGVIIDIKAHTVPGSPLAEVPDEAQEATSVETLANIADTLQTLDTLAKRPTKTQPASSPRLTPMPR